MPPKKSSSSAARNEEVEEQPTKDALPNELVQKILKEFFEDDGTKISGAANDTVGEYIRIFVREAICRATAERRGGDLNDRTVGLGTMLEVEDLEKLAPQLLLDF